jgi:hypothetical protein
MIGSPVAASAWTSAVWFGGLLAISYAWATYLFIRRTSR